eukprot:CAMPEP_0169372888 /NCGR_PEP_ID=MMETSP1017-20121227/36709_1 /TAXON_ID=342587 /ORGANISM="Karlodinium micrum, Strain CCMP2283" /LENGTH=573 /DNA_ID=CAMNT_0009471559 /DNA_START=18 /DNA_END=1735 /DNA_ORIENTATION=+
MTMLIILVGIFSSHTLLANAASLRGQIVGEVSAQDVEASLLTELASTFRPGMPQDHISKLEVELRLLYSVVPQGQDGTLNHAVVRYVLHRFFAQKYGWFIRGLEPGTGNTPSKEQEHQGSQNLQEWVPSYVQSFLEQLQGDRGISLRELAIIAGTLEDLIHKEAVARLRQGYDALLFPQDVPLNEQKARQALEIYMMIYMLGGNFTLKGPSQVMRAHDLFTKKVKDWGASQEWMHGIQMELFPDSAQTPLYFNDTARVVEEVGRRYGVYNDQECGKLKSELLSIESTKAGRVRLTEFYKKGLTGVFEFNEKAEYLRAIGVLDESDPKQPYVIVPNYVSARPNCLVASSFYAVCCRNECEELMATLEQKLSSGTAKPQQILEIASTLSSATVPAQRQISAAMMQRLESIAEKNGGSVPLHGRLFAQWMHHAYPRECPHPHKSGTASPQTPDEWMEITGQSESSLSKEEALQHIDSDTCDENCAGPVGSDARQHHHFVENELPWDDAEELLFSSTSKGQAIKNKPDQRRSWVSRFVFLAVPGFLFFACKIVLTNSRESASKLPLHYHGNEKKRMA